MAALLGTPPRCAAQGPINVLVAETPPFVTDQGGVAAGPYIEAMKLLADREGVGIRFGSPRPMKRLLLEAKQSRNTCVLGVPFAPGEAEVLNYIGRVGPLDVAVYAKRGVAPPIANVAQLRGNTSIASADLAEVRDVLDAEGIVYQTLPASAAAMKMLNAERFAYLVAEEPAIDDLKELSIERQFVLLRTERWLACNTALEPATAAHLRHAISEGLYAASTRPVWASFGLGEHFDRVSKAWRLSTGKQR
ncbi:hypothetical protein GCM10025771_35580 [Niveibacterium umoris]|uniref:Solute-binding protein family 3/N-terminal domain-containing protein n=2 Tax=Niveibacterium umoris TaxID=1193620 RepID=A0A840BDS6_9RHOO|nr:hypothetical protein [Niveibacterium umoris]MBB4011245.1 hypothetical protein [Niveibacterium umoris]